MLQLFRNNTPYTVLILFIFTLLVKMQSLIHPVAPILLPDSFVYNAILHAHKFVLGNSAFGFTMFTVIMLFGQAIYLTNITARHRLYMKPSYTPAFAYIALTALLPAFGYFSPQIIINWLMLYAFDIFLRFSQANSPRKFIFNAGFQVSIIALIQFSGVGYLLLFLLLLLILRSFNAGEWVVALLGYLTPIYFLAGILFLIDKLFLFKTLVKPGISLPAQIPHPLYLVGCMGGIVILFSSGLYVLNDNNSKQAISVRRGWSSTIAYLIISVLVCIFIPKTNEAAWLCCIPALALLTSQPLNLEKNKRFSNFIFYFFIALIVFCQFTVYK